MCVIGEYIGVVMYCLFDDMYIFMFDHLIIIKHSIYINKA